MATEAEYHVGHEDLLQHVAEELRPRLPDSALQSPVIHLFNVCGPALSGRRTFLRRLWGEISPGEVPRVYFTLFPSGGEDIAEQLLSSVLTNRSYLDDVVKRIAEEVRGQAKRLEEAGRPLPAEARLTLWSELVTQNLVEDPRSNRGLQIVVALANFLDFDETRRTAIARELPRSAAGTDCRVLVTTLAGTPKEMLLKYFPDRMPADEILLPPLDLDDVEDWLQKKGIPTEIANEVYQSCGGLAGKLETAASTVVREHQERLLMIAAEKGLDTFSEGERRLLCTSALLPEVNTPSLKILLADDEAQLTMQLLGHVNWSESGWRGSSFFVSAQMRQALLKYFETKFPSDYRRVLPNAEQFARIHASIPSAQDRETMARLSAFNYFNEPLLTSVTPDLADEAMRLARSHPYFESSGANFRMKPEVRQVVENYMKLARYSILPEDKAKISAAWEERRRTIMEQMAAGETKIKRDEGALDGIRSQIKQIAGSIDKELDRISRIRRRMQKKSDKPDKDEGPGQGLQIGRWAMQLMGLVIIYISILVASKTAILYIIFGIALIVGGLFVKGGVLAPAPQAAPIAPPQEGDLEKHEKNLHFLNIKRGQLESRQNIVASNIAREKSLLRDFDKQLREPYS